MLFGAVIAAGHMQIISKIFVQHDSLEASLKDDAYERQPGRAARVCIPDYYCTSNGSCVDIDNGIGR